MAELTDVPAIPAWFDQIITELAAGPDPDGPDPAEAAGWRARVDRDVERLAGRVPMRMVHDWHARTVTPLLVEAGAGAQEAAGRLHARAATGEPIEPALWTEALVPALREVYRRGYAYQEAHAVARASAVTYATEHGFGADETAEFADYYATINTDANVRSFADATAIATADALAVAFAGADEPAYAETWPFAQVRAYAYAAGPDRGAAYRRLAAGLAESLGRVAADG